jgi:hypothetical protein
VWKQTSLIRFNELPVCVCGIGYRLPHSDNLSYPSSTQPRKFPEKRLIHWLRPLPKIIPESLRLTYKGGNASRRHTVVGNGTRTGDLLRRRRRTRNEHSPSGQGERPRPTTYFLAAKQRNHISRVITRLKRHSRCELCLFDNAISSLLRVVQSDVTTAQG